MSSYPAADDPFSCTVTWYEEDDGVADNDQVAEAGDGVVDDDQVAEAGDPPATWSPSDDWVTLIVLRFLLEGLAVFERAATGWDTRNDSLVQRTVQDILVPWDPLLRMPLVPPVARLLPEVSASGSAREVAEGMRAHVLHRLTNGIVRRRVGEYTMVVLPVQLDAVLAHIVDEDDYRACREACEIGFEMPDIDSTLGHDLPPEVRECLWGRLPDLRRFVADGRIEGRSYSSDLNLVILAPLYDDENPRFVRYSVITVFDVITSPGRGTPAPWTSARQQWLLRAFRRAIRARIRALSHVPAWKSWALSGIEEAP